MPASLVGVSGPCPLCGQINDLQGNRPRFDAAPTQAAPSIALPPERRILPRDARASDGWSASLSASRLPDPPAASHRQNAAVGIAVTQADSSMGVEMEPCPTTPSRRVLPPVARGPETIEELLHGVQYTVAPPNRVRGILLQLAALFCLMAPLAVYGPGLARRYLQPKPPAIVKEASTAAASAKTEQRATSQTSPAPTTTTGNRNTTVANSQPSRSSPPASTRQISTTSQRPASRPAQQQAFASPLPPPGRAPAFSSPAPRESPRHIDWGGNPTRPARTVSVTAPTQPPIAAVPVSAPTVPMAWSVITVVPERLVASPHSPENIPGAIESMLARIEEPLPDTPSWMLKPTEQWPQLLLRSQLALRDRETSSQTSACLVDDGNDGWWLLAACDVFGANAGEQGSSEVAQQILRCRASVHGEDNWGIVLAGGPGMDAISAYGCVMMKLQTASSRLVATALPVRSTPVQAGEPLFFTGLPRTDGLMPQCVYPARAEEATPGGETLKFSSGSISNLSHFVGSPLLDQHGELAGVITRQVGAGSGEATAGAALHRALKKAIVPAN